MKTNLKYSQYNNINNNILLHKHKMTAAEQKQKQYTRENKEMNRPARAISFGGSAGLAKFSKKAFSSVVDKVYENEAAFNAIYAWIVAGMLKPLFVLNMPGSEEKDKQIVATKNFLQAFIGGFLGLTIGGGFIKKAIDVVKTNLKLFKIDDNNNIKVHNENSTKILEMAKDIVIKEHDTFKDRLKNASKTAQAEKGIKKITKYFSALFKEAEYEPSIDEISNKAKDLIKNFNDNHKSAFEGNIDFLKQMKSGAGNKTTYEDAFEVLWKNSTGALTAIGKAKISSLLLPSIMAFLFAKKNAQKEAEQKARENILKNNSTFKTQQEQFQKMMNKNNTNLSFKGNLLTSAIDGSARLIELAGMSKFGEKLAKGLSHAKKPSARMADIESIGITAYWLQNTARSKKIEPSQKLGLNVHSALVTVVSSTAAFIIDWALDGIIQKSEKKYKTKLEEIANSVKSMKHGENIDAILKDAPDEIKMGIKNEVVRVLDNKEIKDDLAKITSEDISKILETLNKTTTFKKSNYKIDENLIRRVADSLEQSEPIRKQIKQACSDMIGAEDVAKGLARSIGDEKALANEIKSLTKTYGKKLSKFKSLTIFTLVVRFLVPVLMVPFSGKLKQKIIEWSNKKADNTRDIKK